MKSPQVSNFNRFICTKPPVLPGHRPDRSPAYGRYIFQSWCFCSVEVYHSSIDSIERPVSLLNSWTSTGYFSNSTGFICNKPPVLPWHRPDWSPAYGRYIIQSWCFHSFEVWSSIDSIKTTGKSPKLWNLQPVISQPQPVSSATNRRFSRDIGRTGHRHTGLILVGMEVGSRGEVHG